MLLWPLEDGTCRYCGASIHYGLKEEPSGWTIVVQCDPRDGCSREYLTEWVLLSSVGHVDDVYEQAETVAKSVATRRR